MMRTPDFVRQFRLFILAFSAMICCLCWPQFPPILGGLQSVAASVDIARVEVAQQQVHQDVFQGIEAYRDAQYDQAIERWQAALTHYAGDEKTLDRAIILENLARAYQQLGESSNSLRHWQQSTAVYVALQDWSKVSRTLAQQAQVYGQLGQPYQAIGLLCSPNADLFETGGGATRFDENLCEQMSAITIAQRVQDGQAEVAALGSLSEAYRAIQAYGLAQQVAELGLEKLPAVVRHDSDGDRGSADYERSLLLNSLGNALKGSAELKYQQAVLAQRGLTGGAQRLRDQAEQYRQTALEKFEQSGAIARQVGNAALEIKTLLGQISVISPVVSMTSEMTSETAADLRNQAIALLDGLSPNQEKVYLMLQLAKQPRSLTVTDGETMSLSASRSQCLDIIPGATTASLLQQAAALSTELQNNRLLSFAQGEIGHYYECSKDYDQALHWTRQARLAASGDRVSALDTLYLWQWQTGRIYRDLEQTEKAIESYTQAVDNLDRVRSEILASDRNLQFDFRDSVAPVYRELAEIRLALVPSIDAVKADRIPDEMSGDRARQNIRSALGAIDGLQLAELQNYFGSDCLVPVVDLRLDDVISSGRNRDAADKGASENSSKQNSSSENSGGENGPSENGSSENSSSDDKAALISTVIFPDRTAVILTLPDQPPLLHWIELSEEDLRQSVIDLRYSLEDPSNELGTYDTSLAQQLYQYIISPFSASLADNKIKTLIFMNDGIFRTIPMAALYDGQQYLVEQYALAIAPSLQKSADFSKSPLPDKALILGLSVDSIVDGQPFPPLPAVRREVEEVLSLFPDGDLLLNETFTKNNLKQNLSDRSYPVLHIATHGKFESTPNKTFLITGDTESVPSDENEPSENEPSENEPSENEPSENQPPESQPPENQPLRLGELDNLVRTGSSEFESGSNLLDLIVLSACQTATGDERSSLGLAGVTIRAGAETALASLWSVNDTSTADLMTYFYQNWNSGFSKSQALRKAQIQVMKDPKYYGHPAHWSAFLLVGDWQ